MTKWINYDNITLIPTQVSTLEHRSEADTSVMFGKYKLDLPLIAAPMPDVTNGKMATTLQGHGSFGWVHRFQDWKEARKELETYGPVGLAVSYKDIDFAVSCYHEYGVRTFCIDIANGMSVQTERAIKTLKELCPDAFVVAGNIASSQGFWKLQEWGADAIRVGIGGGSVCTTRDETGIYAPAATLISEITGINIGNDHPTIVYTQPLYQGYGYQQYPVGSGIGWTNYYQVVRPVKKALLIADGGIKAPGDMCKALALGADLVMAGGIFAGTDEAPGEIDEEGYKKFSGAASYDIQKKSGRNEIVYVEGKTTIVSPKGPVGEVIKRYAAGLRSSMSYMNARNLTEYRVNAKIVEIK